MTKTRVKDPLALLRLIKTPRYKIKSRGEVRTDPELANQILDHLPKTIWKDGAAFLDPFCGRGTFIVSIIERLKPYHSTKDILNMVYGVDIDPWCVYTTKKVVADYLGVDIKKVVNIIQGDSLTKEYNMEFDAVVGNPPFNIHDGEGGQGTGGNVNLYKQISDVCPVKPGGVKALITPKGMIKHLLKDPDYNPLTINLMTAKDYWKYNTCYWVVKREPNVNTPVIADPVIDKVFLLDNNPNFFALQGLVRGAKADYQGSDKIRAIVQLPMEKSGLVYGNVDPKWDKVIFGPKFCATMLESKVSYTVTDEPMVASFYCAIPTKTLAEAEQVRLFVEQSDILRVLHKRLKTKGLVWTIRHLKPFDPGQFVTGKEIPREWNLTQQDLAYLGL